MKKTLLTLSAFVLATAAQAENVTSEFVIGAMTSDEEVRRATTQLVNLLRQSVPNCTFAAAPVMQQHLLSATGQRNANGALLLHKKVYLVSKYVACSLVANGTATSYRRAVTAKVVVNVAANGAERPERVVVVSITNDE